MQYEFGIITRYLQAIIARFKFLTLCWRSVFQLETTLDPVLSDFVLQLHPGLYSAILLTFATTTMHSHSLKSILLGNANVLKSTLNWRPYKVRTVFYVWKCHSSGPTHLFCHTYLLVQSLYSSQGQRPKRSHEAASIMMHICVTDLIQSGCTIHQLISQTKGMSTTFSGSIHPWSNRWHKVQISWSTVDQSTFIEFCLARRDPISTHSHNLLVQRSL